MYVYKVSGCSSLAATLNTLLAPGELMKIKTCGQLGCLDMRDAQTLFRDLFLFR
jgi:hypothetical protein